VLKKRDYDVEEEDMIVESEDGVYEMYGCEVECEVEKLIAEVGEPKLVAADGGWGVDYHRHPLLGESNKIICCSDGYDDQ
jgi:hypothetical protein